MNQSPVPDLPSPLRNRPFLSFLATQFLGAFNDNVFKQVVLLLAVAAASKGTTDLPFQGIVGALFTIPFVLFTSFAGDLADRYSKGTVIVWCKVAEIVVMAIGIGMFMMGETVAALWALAALAFIMGMQSAFFGPAKYTVVPELVREVHVAPASGLTQMTTMIAIVVGTGLAGVLFDWLRPKDMVWMVGLVCTGIAVLGTVTSLGITRRPAADPHCRVGMASTVRVFSMIRQLWRHDRKLFYVIISWSWFWFAGALVLIVLNDWGRRQLGFTNTGTSMLVATTSLGIGIGSFIGGLISAQRIRLNAAMPGLALMAVAFILLALIPVGAPYVAPATPATPAPASDASGVLPVPGGQAGTLTTVIAFAALTLLGAAGGIYIVPLLAYTQVRPAEMDKGRVMAAAQFLNW
ncbi:MAG: MFS transporter, partial [Planctomycetota bacterium]